MRSPPDSDSASRATVTGPYPGALLASTVPLGTVVHGLTLLQTEPGPVPDELTGLEAFALRATGFLLGFVVVLLIGLGVVEPLMSRLIRRRNRNNPTIEEAITRYIRLVVLVVAVFVALSAAGYTDVVSNSAIVIAALTLGLGIAGQNVVGSLVSGTALVVDPEFNVGDYIEWADGEGEVTSITLRVTRVETPDGGLVTIPNTRLTDDPIVKPFQGNDARTVEHVEIAYESDAETALRLLREITADLDGVLDDPPPRAGVDELGDDGVVLRVEFWVEDPRWELLPVRSAFARAVTDRFERAGIEVSPSTKRDLEGHVRIDES